MRSFLVAGIIALTGFGWASPIRRQQRTSNLDISQSLQTILDESGNNPANKYPTDFTRGIIPVPVHSHNDYWREVPFYSALSVGCTSIEADVWLYNDTLYVGHEVLALTPERTFDALYVQPILNVLSRENPRGLIAQTTAKNGVFDADAGQTLYLWVDVKTNGANTWPYVVRALEPLRRAGYLTTVNGTTVTTGQVTVIGTGETPLDQIQGVSDRDYFYDANVALLNTTQANIGSSVSPIASGDFVSSFGPISGDSFNSTQLATLRSQIAAAKSKGIGVRYWDAPAFPISRRNAVWATLFAEGVALISADDLPAAAGVGTSEPW